MRHELFFGTPLSLLLITDTLKPHTHLCKRHLIDRYLHLSFSLEPQTIQITYNFLVGILMYYVQLEKLLSITLFLTIAYRQRNIKIHQIQIEIQKYNQK